MSEIEPDFTGKTFDIIRQIVRSLILYTATTTDANYNLLKTMTKYKHSILEKEGGFFIGSSCMMVTVIV